jgi:hypothetical protein
MPLGARDRGFGASFPKGVEWQVWWDHWKPLLGELQPWERFFVDACTTLQQAHVTMSRKLRKVEWTSVGWTPEEMGSMLALVEEKHAWYHKNRPRDFELPTWARIGFQALDGAYENNLRLARELDQINRRGYALVNTGEEAAAIERAA